MAWLCYAEDVDISRGKNLLFGMMHFFPELDRNVWAVESESGGFSEKAQLHYKFVTLTRD